MRNVVSDIIKQPLLKGVFGSAGSSTATVLLVMWTGSAGSSIVTVLHLKWALI